MTHNEIINDPTVPIQPQAVGTPFQVSAHFDFNAGAPPPLGGGSCNVGLSDGQEFIIGAMVRDSTGAVLDRADRRGCFAFGVLNTGRTETFDVSLDSPGTYTVQFYMEQVTGSEASPEHSRQTTSPLSIEVVPPEEAPQGENGDGGGDDGGFSFTDFVIDDPALAVAGGIAGLAILRQATDEII